MRAPGTPQSQVMSIPLYELDRLSDVDHRTCLYVPPLREIENVRTFSGLMWLTRTLRAPGGCPWDREQTHETLKPHLLEETYEVLDALDRGDPAETSEEMGDLLFSIAQLSRKLGIEPETALRKANDKFTKRFTAMERAIAASGANMSSMALEQIEHQWQQTKSEQETDS